MRFQPHLAEGFDSREEMRAAAVEMRLAGHSRSQIAKALGFKTGGATLDEWLRKIPPPEWTKRPRAKDELRETAVAMRLEGRSYREIKEVLGVSKSSLSLWLRDVPMTDEQREALYFRRVEGAERRTVAIRAHNLTARQRTVNQARAQIQQLAESELFVAGVVAYWAEGSKAKPWRPTTLVSFMNSDPGLILLFIRWLQLLGVGLDCLKFRISIHESADVPAATEFWSNVIGMTASRFQRPTLKRHNPKSVRRNVGHTYHGCLVITVEKSSELYRRIAGWFGGLVQILLADPPTAPGVGKSGASGYG
jgi:transposase